MFKRVARLKYFCGLDLGSSEFKVALVKAQDAQNLELLGVFQTRAMGLKDGSVSDLEDLSQCIKSAVKSVARKFSVEVRSLRVGIGADALSVHRSAAVIPLIDAGTKVISPSDIRKVNHQARLLGVDIDEETIHDFPQMYRVDDVNAALNPAGLFGRKLESNILILAAKANRLRNVVQAVHQAGFEVDRLSCSSYAAAEVVLDKNLKDRGCVLVDIGAKLTNVLLFKDGVLRDIQLIPWGGQYVTQTLADRLSLTIEKAEEIKRLHAVAAPGPSAETGDILVLRATEYVPVSRQSVCDAVGWEIENFLTHLETVIEGSVLVHDLNGGIVMVGGGALLPGLMERVEQRVHLPVGMGVGAKGLNNVPVFAGAIGLAKMNYLQNTEESIHWGRAGQIKNKVLTQLKDMCQEYF